MTTIRALEQSDLRQVADVFQRVFRPGSEPAGAALVDFLSRTFVDGPSVDREIPSLVATAEDRRIIGFIGASVRRMRLRDRPVRLVVSSHLGVDPLGRSGAVGARLLERLLAGPQDMTITDAATPTTRRLWEGLGGDTVHLQCIEWVRLLRPFSLAVGLTRARRGRPGPSRADRLASPLDAVAGAFWGERLRVTAPAGTAEPLTVTGLLDAVSDVGRRLALVPEYDPAFVEYLFAELDRAEPGARGVRQLVRGSDGSALGWYVYLLRPGRRSEALQVAAKGRHVDRVFDQLLWHAYSHGSAALSGRLEPRLLEPVSGRHCLLRPGPSSLVHSRDPEAVDAIRSGATLLSRLDGDWTPAPR